MPRTYWSPNAGPVGQQQTALVPGQNLSGMQAVNIDGTDISYPAPGGGLLRVPVGGGAAAQMFGSNNGQLVFWDANAGQWLPTTTAPADGDVARWNAATNTWVYAAPPTPGALAYFDTTFSPVALWNFNGTLADQSGNGNNLVVEAGTTNFADIVPGKLGLWIVSGSRVAVPAPVPALNILGDMTLQAIVQLNSTPTSQFIPAAHAGTGELSSGNIVYSLIVTATATFTAPIAMGSFWETGAGTDVSFNTSSPASLAPIHNILYLAQVRSAGGTRVQHYVNGKPFGALSGALTAPTDGSLGRFVVGAVSPAGTSAESGIIMAVKMNNSALSAAQILSEYNRTMGPAFGVLS